MLKRKRYQAGSVTKSSDGRYWLGKYRDVAGVGSTKLLGKCTGVGKISKSDAANLLVDVVRPINGSDVVAAKDVTVGEFVDNVFLPFKRRKWKKLTNDIRTESITREVIGGLGNRTIVSLRRDELQDWLDGLRNEKGERRAFSMVDHLRWDLKSILDLAVADGIIPRNPIYQGRMLLSMHPDCPRPKQPVMSSEDVKRAISALTSLRERLVFKLVVLGGMRQSEVFGLRRGRIHGNYAEIAERVCRRNVDRPKTWKSERDAALAIAVQQDLKLWLGSSPDTGPDGWLFPSETLKTAIGADNVMLRHMRPLLKTVGLGWVDYRVMRRTHSSLMKELKVDPKLVADQEGHGVDVNQNVYTQTPVAHRLEAVETLSAFVN
jgi:integrase